MIQPLQRDSAFLADLAREAGNLSELKLWWLGQSGFILRCAGSYLLLDPYLSDSLTRKYSTTDKPHVRMTERVIAPELLARIDVITSSHNHTDHLDAETLLPIFGNNPNALFVIPEANREFVAERLGTDPYWPTGLDDGTAVELCGWRISGVAAAHNEIAKDRNGRCQFLGYIIQRGRWTIYHSGDTLVYEGLPERLRAFRPINLALLPINGNKPERRVAGNMDGREAAILAKTVGAGLVIPHHFEMFEFNTADPRELFIPECEGRAQPYRVLRAGQGLVAGS